MLPRTITVVRRTLSDRSSSESAGDDCVDFVSEHGGLSTEILDLKDRRLGLDGNDGYPLQVLVCRK